MTPEFEQALKDISLRMRLLKAAQEARAGSDDLNDREMLLLELLEKKGRMTISQICEAYPDLSESTVSMHVTKMWRDKGLVSKTVDPDNQRITWVEVTDTGHETLRLANEQRRDRFKMFFHAIAVTDEEKKILIDVMNRASDFIDKHLVVLKEARNSE